jgi:hypothetical protein
VEIKPMTEPGGPSFSARLPRANPIRVAIVAGVGIVLALSAAITLAASPSPRGAGSGPTTAAGSPGPNLRSGGFGQGFGPGRIGTAIGGASGPGRFGGFAGFGGFGAFGGVSVASIDGSSLSLKTADGWTRTIAVTSSTRITRGGQTIALSDLKVGDTIGFRESKAANGSFTIDAISVILPRVFGQVTATTSTTITIKQFDGTTAAIHVGSSTTFRIFGVDKATIASLKVGMTISAEGTKGSDGSLSALTVSGGQVRMPFQGGGHKAPGAAPSAAPGA